MKRLLSLAILGVLIGYSVPAGAKVTERNFRLESLGDLVALCGVSADDPDAAAAIHMCHGYVIGLAQFHGLLDKALEGSVYCIPENAKPTRNQAIGQLVDWSRQHPDQNEQLAINGVLVWLADEYPCP